MLTRFTVRIAILAVFVLAASAAFSLLASAAGNDPVQLKAITSEGADDAQYVPGELIVRFKSGTSAAEQREIRSGSDVRLAERLPVAGTQRVKITDGASVKSTIADLEDQRAVAYAEPNYLRHLSATPDDSMFGVQWAMENTGQYVWGFPGTPDADIDATDAWDTETGSSNVTVAVIDTGVEYAHDDLTANIWANPGESGGGKETNGTDDDNNGYVDDYHGWDFEHGDNDPNDQSSLPELDDVDGFFHGTHVAGTIAAVGNNNLGVAGVSWNSKVMPIRVCCSTKYIFTSAEIAAGFSYAGSNGADIANGSFGGGGYSQAELDAVRNASDTLFVFAAGNDANDNDVNPTYPCGLDAANVVCVAATDNQDNLAGFSSYGDTSVDLGAPGVGIRSTYHNDGYATADGTSMASPHVAGAAALIKSDRPNLSPSQIRKILIDSTDPVAALNGKVVSDGRLNVNTALSAGQSGSADVFVSGSTLRYVAAEGNVDTLNVAVSGSNYVLGDTASGTLAPGSGCSAITASSVQCPTAGVSTIDIDTGNLADTITIDSSVALGVKVFSGTGDDTINGGGAGDTINGGGGSDTIYGNGGDDSILSRDSVPDFVYCGGGSDSVDADVVDSMPGSDCESSTASQLVIASVASGTLTVATANGEENAITVGNSNGLTLVHEENYVLAAGSGCTSISLHTVSCGLASATTAIDIDSGDMDDAVSVNHNAPVALDLGTGWDHGTGGPGNDTINGGEGVDTIDGGAGDDVVNGDEGFDRLTGGADDDQVNGGNDNDYFWMDDPGADAISGGAGHDHLTSYYDAPAAVSVTQDGLANDGMSGEGDNVAGDVEEIHGTRFNDTISGGAIDNALVGHLGDDTISGGGGNDFLEEQGTEADTDDISGGSGTDFVVENNSVSFDQSISLDDNANDGGAGENDNIHSDIEIVLSGSGNDTLTGNSNDNIMLGNAGDDVIYGMDGNDKLDYSILPGMIPSGFTFIVYTYTDDGSDLIDGGNGSDTVSYNQRTNPLTISLDGAANDGESGEDDNLVAIETVEGGGGNDNITGGSGSETLVGGLTPYTGMPTYGFVTTTGDDFLAGQDGADTLNGLDGNDNIDSGAGADVANGGDGYDTASYTARFTNVNVSLDDVANDGDATDGSATDNVKADIEQVQGGAGDDTITGSSVDNFLAGNGGNDTIDGGAGSDMMLGAAGNDTVSYASHSGNVTATLDETANNDGEPGEDDSILYEVENVTGGSGNDQLFGDSNANTLAGGTGNDALIGEAGADVLQGGADSDEVNYTNRSSNLTISIDGVANDGDSTDGSTADNVNTDVESVQGGSGNDTITGSSSNNFLSGNGGNDTIDGGAGADTMLGASGTDTVTYANRSNPVYVSLDDVSSNDGETGEQDSILYEVENVIGGAGNDTIYGSTSGNSLDGRGGNDILAGGPGADTLLGGNNNDTLGGDSGNDTLNGEAGNDTFDGEAGLEADTFTGGSGTDHVNYVNRTADLTITLDGVANDGAATEADNLATDVEDVTTGTGNDSITGQSSGTVANTFTGGGGNDTFSGGTGADVFNGGIGTDTVTYAYRTTAVTADIDGVADDAGESDNVKTDVENMIGGTANDTLTGQTSGSVANALTGGGGTDTLNGNDGNDTLQGDAGADTFNGGTGTDTVTYAYRTTAVTADIDGVADDAGESDNVKTDVENMIGGTANDTLTGQTSGTTANALTGGGGNDTLNGNTGNDTLQGDAGADTFNGGTGTDTVSYAYRSTAVTADIDGVADDAGESDNVKIDVENITGGTAGDTLTGQTSGSVANVLIGGGGNDVLNGNDGNDTLQGDAGTDTASGGTGNDAVLIRNSDNDNTTVCGAGTDTVTADVLPNDPVNADCETVNRA